MFNPSATKKVAKKNFFNDIAKINTVVNFFNNSYAMYIVELKTFKMPVKKYQNMQKALRLRKNTFLLFAFVSLLSKNNFLLDLRSLILSRIWFQSQQLSYIPTILNKKERIIHCNLFITNEELSLKANNLLGGIL